MGKVTGFKEFDRELPRRRPVQERIQHFREFYEHWTEEQARNQGARCMNCGVPFCHGSCPLGNLIPDWNDLVYRGQWESALAVLSSTNNFPEFTGRICPAPCEAACTLAINQNAVSIEHIERAIADRAFDEGWLQPSPPLRRTGKKVAVVGSGPAGLAAAAQLNSAGHWVTVLERDEYIGGLLTLGIPGFKLEKEVVQRRLQLMQEEGVEFCTGAHVGINYSLYDLRSGYDAIVLAGGSTQARNLDVPGRELDGIHFAMEYLPQQNRLDMGQSLDGTRRIDAEGRRVVILGGGDTGADCLGTAHRQGAEVVHQLEILSQPPDARAANNPWPEWPIVLRPSAAHEEGGLTDYAVATKAFTGENGHVSALHAVYVEWTRGENGRPVMQEIEGSDFQIETELVLLALGFLHPEHEGMINDLGVELDARGNVSVNRDKATSEPGIFAAGDMARGQSLVVWAIAEGRAAAHGVDKYLMGSSGLPWVTTKFDRR